MQSQKPVTSLDEKAMMYGDGCVPWDSIKPFSNRAVPPLPDTMTCVERFLNAFWIFLISIWQRAHRQCL